MFRFSQGSFRFSRNSLRILFLIFLAFRAANAAGAAKAHVITFGKWTTVHDIADSAAATEADKLPHAENSFAVGRRADQRIYLRRGSRRHRPGVRGAARISHQDNVPQDPAATPHWQWQRGGWLLVDRVTGRISPVNLPEFDSTYSVVSWYRDYAAYCGLSDDEKDIYAMVAQVGRRKPLVKWQIGEVKLRPGHQKGRFRIRRAKWRNGSGLRLGSPLSLARHRRLARHRYHRGGLM